jgi:outer membrane protein assembly factor BamB
MILSVLGLTLAVGACKDAVTDPSTQGDTVAVRMEMLPFQRPLSFIGMTLRIGARTVAADGTFLRAAVSSPQLLTWVSDAPDVVSVNQVGVVTAVREGTARISATSGGVTGTTTVTVRDAIRLAWFRPLDGLPSGLAVAAEGTAYVPVFVRGSASTLEAVAPDGQRLWSVFTGETVNSAPAIALDGNLYFGTFESFMAVDRSGAVRWMLDDIGRVGASPAVGPDGTVYVATLDRILYAIEPRDGQKRWAFRADTSFSSSPAFARDGTILVGANDGRFYAVRPDGTQRWTFETGGSIQSKAAIAPDGTIYFGSLDQHLYALTPDGDFKWSLPLPLAGASSSAAIGPDGTVYIGGDGLHAVHPSGRLQWTYPGPNPGSGTLLFSTPVVTRNGSIYTAGGRSLFALTADGTLKWDYPTRLGARQSMIGPDGTIFGVASDSTLYAIVERGGSTLASRVLSGPTSSGDRTNTKRSGRP